MGFTKPKTEKKKKTMRGLCPKSGLIWVEEEEESRLSICDIHLTIRHNAIDLFLKRITNGEE